MAEMVPLLFNSRKLLQTRFFLLGVLGVVQVTMGGSQNSFMVLLASCADRSLELCSLMYV